MGEPFLSELDPTVKNLFAFLDTIKTVVLDI